jgi:mono/diheme cytochrome c family protein
MKTSLEVKALRYGLLTALLSLGGTGLAAIAIRALPSSILPPMASEASFSQTVVTPEIVAKGHEYYDMSCSHCHGDDASGDDDGPDLHDLRISNARIAVAIKKGIKDQMPNFAKKYNDAQIKALVSYLRTLR